MSKPFTFKPISIKIPQYTHKKERDELDPYFPVLDIPLKRDYSGLTDLKFVPKEETGDRHLVNANTGETVGKVAENYKVYTHQQADELVFGFLDKIGLKYQKQKAQVSNNGARFFQTILFPDLAFNPSSTVPSTALDMLSAGHEMLNQDVFFPTAVWKNSYDKTCKLSFHNGLYRLWCKNGAALPVIGSDVELSYRHTQVINENKVRAILIDRLEQSTTLGARLYERLNFEGGTEYLQAVLNSAFSDKFKKAILDKLADNASIDLDVKVDPETQKVTEWVIQEAKTKVSGYALYNVVTEVSTHQLTNRYEREVTDRKIAKIFVPRELIGA